MAEKLEAEIKVTADLKGIQEVKKAVENLEQVEQKQKKASKKAQQELNESVGVHVVTQKEVTKAIRSADAAEGQMADGSKSRLRSMLFGWERLTTKVPELRAAVLGLINPFSMIASAGLAAWNAIQKINDEAEKLAQSLAPFEKLGNLLGDQAGIKADQTADAVQRIVREWNSLYNATKRNIDAMEEYFGLTKSRRELEKETEVKRIKAQGLPEEEEKKQIAAVESKFREETAQEEVRLAQEVMMKKQYLVKLLEQEQKRLWEVYEARLAIADQAAKELDAAEDYAKKTRAFAEEQKKTLGVEARETAAKVEGFGKIVPPGSPLGVLASGLYTYRAQKRIEEIERERASFEAGAVGAEAIAAEKRRETRPAIESPQQIEAYLRTVTQNILGLQPEVRTAERKFSFGMSSLPLIQEQSGLDQAIQDVEAARRNQQKKTTDVSAGVRFLKGEMDETNQQFVDGLISLGQSLQQVRQRLDQRQANYRE